MIEKVVWSISLIISAHNSDSLTGCLL